MDDWFFLPKTNPYSQSGLDVHKILSGQHTWHATSHARPTYCNVCREQLSGVTSHGLSCEVCKCKVHKRCVAKTINNCKWTTLASVGKEIIEDKDGNILMPHQWMEGNLPVSTKCAVCEKTCGSVLKLQDWRCLWCRTSAHTACRPKHSTRCPLGPNHVSVIPPTAIHSIGTDDTWEAVRPQGCSPLLVFVNSKSGDNQGVKFLRRFRQILNPAQVFDLISSGPTIGLKLFRHFDPFRVLVCSGDGSVGWVLCEIDRLNMQFQCEVGVLPLGTGNDLARVLGWGASCDDDTHLPQLLERYERASPKILDRWSIMVFERNLNVGDVGKLAMTTGLADENDLPATATAYENSVLSHLTNILQSNRRSVVVESVKMLCETVNDFVTRVSDMGVLHGDKDLNEKCRRLRIKLSHLLEVLKEEQLFGEYSSNEFESNIEQNVPSNVAGRYGEKCRRTSTTMVGTDCEQMTHFYNPYSHPLEKLAPRQLIGWRDHTLVHDTKPHNFLKKDRVTSRADSLKRAVRLLVEHAEKATDDSVANKQSQKRQQQLSPILDIPNVGSISPLPDFRRDSSCSAEINLESLPVPKEFADSRHGSFAGEPFVEDRCDIFTNLVESETYANSPPIVFNQTEDKLRPSGGGEADRAYKLDGDENVCGGIEESGRRDCFSEMKDQDWSKNVGGEWERKGVASTTNTAERGVFECGERSTTIGPNELQAQVERAGKMAEAAAAALSLAAARSRLRRGGGLVGSLSEELANIGHIDSSETSDDSPEGSTIRKEDVEVEVDVDVEQEKQCGINRSSLRDSMKESERSFAISIGGVCDAGSELDMTNLFSTSPEEEEECSEEYRREMGLESVKRCSIAHFVEGSDIARKSFKCRHRNKSLDDLENECIAVPPECRSSSGSEQKSASNNTVLEIPRIRVSAEDACVGGNDQDDSDQGDAVGVDVRICGSVGNLASTYKIGSSDRDSRPDRTSFTVSETDNEEYVRFGRLDRHDDIGNSDSTGPTVVIDPPSPPYASSASVDVDVKIPNEQIRMLSDNCRRLSAASPLMSLHCSPSPTRRISNISIPPTELASGDSKEYQCGKTAQKTLPIINPLVGLPQWPNITEPGIVGKVLLANADALCAAAVPLMDPDETLMEGFFERCVMNNYFGIGIDAKISLDFHHKREEHPEKCRSRTRNYMWYGVLGSKQWYQKSCKNLEQRLQLECDGQRIPLPSLQGIVVLNIPSFMGGINFWGGTKEDDIFLAPSFDDHILEVVAVFGTVQMAASRLLSLQHHRIAQCSTIQINILGEEGVPVQVDGEAWIQPPGMIRIIHKSRMKMLCRNKALESSLRAWEEKQRQIRQQHRLQSGVCKLTSLTDEEMNILLTFIDATISLTKYVKLFIIRHPTIEADLYRLAATVGINLERVHPSGKILRGLELRPAVTELVISVQRLTVETNALLRDKNLQIAPDIEREMNSALLQMEVELKKCTFGGTAQHSLVYLRIPSPDESERKNTLGRKSSGAAFWQRFRRGSGVSPGVGDGGGCKFSKREVSTWGVAEVSGWLESLQLGEYAESFAANDVRGRELLTLTRRDLKELGVVKVGHIKRLTLALREFVS